MKHEMQDMWQGCQGYKQVSLLDCGTAVRFMSLFLGRTDMSGRDYEKYSYCNGCSERRMKRFPKETLRCDFCKQKLRHKPKSPSSRRREAMNNKRI